jgi:hypothetical protein
MSVAAVASGWGGGEVVDGCMVQASDLFLAQVVVSASVPAKEAPPGFVLLSWNATSLSEIKTRELLSQTPTGSSRRAWETALKAFKAARIRCQEEYFKQQADDLNEIYHQKVNERSTNGEKRFWNAAKRLPGMGVGKVTTPAMMVDPASGQLQCTKHGVQGVLAAQVHHTQLGSQQQFTQANPQFDDAWLLTPCFFFFLNLGSLHA